MKQPAPPRNRLLAWLAAGAAILVLGAGVLTAPRFRPKPLPPLYQPAALSSADQLYQARGGKYVWGTNDCSCYVLDYLKQVPFRVSARYTTADFSNPAEMRAIGLRPIKGTPQFGDILVFRYVKNGEPMGHCGVVTARGNELWVKHNSAAQDGITVESYDDFLKRAELFTHQPGKVKILRPPPGPGLKAIKLSPSVSR